MVAHDARGLRGFGDRDAAQPINLRGARDALAAAFFAANDGGEVTMSHLLHATQREFQKMGKTLTEAELKGHATVIPLEGRRA